jgi:hypothetical protein
MKNNFVYMLNSGGIKPFSFIISLTISGLALSNLLKGILSSVKVNKASIFPTILKIKSE